MFLMMLKTKLFKTRTVQLRYKTILVYNNDQVGQMTDHSNLGAIFEFSQ